MRDHSKKIKKKKKKLIRDIKSRRYMIELNEFEEKFVLFKDTNDSVEEKEEILFKKM